MELCYRIYDPTKNITALVTTPVPRFSHAAVAAKLMEALPFVEQTGFLEKPADPTARLRLQMMGGEFCGNAAMSAAVYLAEQDKLPQGEEANYLIEVSGNPGVLCCRIERRDKEFLGTVSMPLPEEIIHLELKLPEFPGALSVPAVRFPGIIHCIVPADRMTRQTAQSQLPALCDRLKSDACGFLLFDERSTSFTPLVYVASTDTAVWESGCGSGSAAIGAYLSELSGADGDVVLQQPGGSIRVCSHRDGGQIAALAITGQVRGAGAGHLDFNP